MATFKKYKPKTEKELHGVIEKEIDALEEGLELLKYEMGIGKSIPDFLCVDSGGRLVIIEVKLQEDNHILFQALKYYSEIDKNRYVITKIFSNKNIRPEETPRIILIAERFSDDVKRWSTLVVPDVELYEYTVGEDSNEKRGIIYHPVSLPKIDELPPTPTEIKDHREYITKEEIKPIFDEIRENIKSIDHDIDEYSTQNYVGYKYKGRQLAWISTQRKSFDIGAHILDEKGLVEYDSKRIETGKEDYIKILEKIKKSFQIARL